MPDWEIVVGLETHAQLTTASKIFSGASTAFGAPPNTQASAVDIALPGTLPVLNKGAVERAIRFGLAVGGKIAERCVFARKNYFYPDLPKGYQISQYEQPIVSGGTLTFIVGDEQKTVRLTRAHLEEDAGKLLHEAYPGMSGVDLNRAGTPLLEIVTEPDMRSAAEAIAYAKALHEKVTWLGICDGNMQEGSFRCDANVSVRKRGADKLGTRCEIKNLNSFRFLEMAIDYEIRRQIEILEDGGSVIQETRLYDPDRNETRSMRSKEDAHDYRYFPDPDLLPLAIDSAWVDELRKIQPEMPEVLRARFVSFGFSLEQAYVLTSDRERAIHFDRFWRRLLELNPVSSERTVDAANWMMMEVGSELNRTGKRITEISAPPEALALLVTRVLDGTISRITAKKIFWRMEEVAMTDPQGPDRIIEAGGLRQISDAGAVEAAVDQVIAANPKLVDDFRAGKEKAFNALVGQVMKATQGKANPAQVNEILRRKL